MKTKLICNKVRLLVIAITLFVSISAQARENSKNTIDSTSAALTQLIIKNYGPIKDDPSLSAGLYGYIHKKLTGEEIKVKENIADAYYSVSFEGTPNLDVILEIFQEIFDKLKASGYPITPDRVLFKITENEGKNYIALALDETYIYPQTVVE